MLLITHRQEGLDLVDEVITLDSGRIVAHSDRVERPPGRAA